MIPEKMQELQIILTLSQLNYNSEDYDIVAINKRGEELLEEFLQPYKVNPVDDNTTKVG